MTTPALSLASPTAEPQLAAIEDTARALITMAINLDLEYQTIDRDQSIQLVLAAVTHWNAQLKLGFDAYCVGLDIAEDFPTIEQMAAAGAADLAATEENA
jgi:hypothetical protein